MQSYCLITFPQTLESLAQHLKPLFSCIMNTNAKEWISSKPATFGEKYFKEMTVGQVMDSDKFQEEYEKWRIDAIVRGKRRRLEDN